jgi:hypothetical protein
MLEVDKSKLHEMRTFIESSRAEVEAEIRFCADDFAPFHELVSAKLVRLYAKPSKLWSAILLGEHYSVKENISYLFGLCSLGPTPSSQ